MAWSIAMFIQLKKILVVDDVEDFRVLLKNWISFRGLEAIAAENGREAISILEKERIDLIMTDFQMPEMDGLELLEWCRQHNISVPVIFMSASEAPLDRERIALGDCCATRLEKPLNFKILAAALDAAERHDHHRDCLHQPYKIAVEAEYRLSELGDKT
jgi:CheY-like chemotaxis protein